MKISTFLTSCSNGFSPTLKLCNIKDYALQLFSQEIHINIPLGISCGKMLDPLFILLADPSKKNRFRIKIFPQEKNGWTYMKVHNLILID
jgi:hypothetical protein